MHARTFAWITAASLAIVTLTFFSIFAAPAIADEASHKVMDRWVGHWTGGVAGANTEGVAATPDHADAAWTLDDNFVQGTNSTAAGKPIGVWLLHHDSKSGKFKVWFFSARGGVGEWTGTWNDADNKMTWEGTDSPSGAKLTGYTKIAGNHQEWNLQVDNAGKVTTDSGSLERKKSRPAS
jgi:hypothetical protein